MNNRFQYEKARLYEVVDHILRAAISAGDVPPDALLQEAALAEKFGISRAPVRQAMMRLEEDGLLKKLEGKGYALGAIQVDEQTLKPYLPDRIPEAALQAFGSGAEWQKIYDNVESEILHVMPFGKYMVVENELAESRGVSRTVTRNVLSRLEERGLLEKSTRKHWVVPQLTAKFMTNLYEMRHLLEPAALIKAWQAVPSETLISMRDRLLDAERRFPDVSLAELNAFEKDLHVDILDHCDNPRLLTAMRQSQVPLAATSHLFQQYIGLPQDEPFLLEHRLVLEHLINGAPEAAAAALEAHMKSALRKGLNRLEALSEITAPKPPAYLELLA